MTSTHMKPQLYYRNNISRSIGHALPIFPHQTVWTNEDVDRRGPWSGDPRSRPRSSPLRRSARSLGRVEGEEGRGGHDLDFC